MRYRAGSGAERARETRTARASSVSFFAGFKETRDLSVKKFAGLVLAGAAAASIPALAAAQATLTLGNGSPLPISTFSYAANGSLAGELKVTSSSYILCANVGPDYPTSLRTFSPTRDRWTLPSVQDMQSMRYSGSTLRINQSGSPSTIACTVRSENGTVSSPFGPFDDLLLLGSFDLPTRDQWYASMVNWQPNGNYASDGNGRFAGWSPEHDSVLPGVPTDACTFDQRVAPGLQGDGIGGPGEPSLVPDLPLSREVAVCAAATGVRPAPGTGPSSAPAVNSDFGMRAATMWTRNWTDGSTPKFAYLARVDARLGAQGANELPNSSFPQAPSGGGAMPTANSVEIVIADAYDSEYLEPVASYCFLRELPATLDAGTCAGNNPGLIFADSANGNLRERIVLDLGTVRSNSRYLAVIRNVKVGGSPLAVDTPVAAVSVFASPDVVQYESGNKFTGDDVVFGFPGANLFPWMR